MSTLSRQVRSVLEALPDAVSLAELLLLVDDFVVKYSSSIESGTLLFQLESELQAIHQDIVAHSSLYQTEVFLAVLYHLCAVLSPTSIISTWHDLVLRPALREPKLPTAAVNHAKELIISALHTRNESNVEKVEGFRRHLLDLYLLDAFNDGSGIDVLELEKLDEEHREKKTCWKSNLEDVLLKFGAEQPQDLLTEVHNSFQLPSSRLQLLILLNTYTSRQSFSSSAAVLATHPLMTKLLSSILLDNSSTVCTIGLTLLVKLIPIFAVHACTDLKNMIPQLLAILARFMCWKEAAGLFDATSQDDDVLVDAEVGEGRDFRVNRTLHIHPDANWQHLKSAFGVSASSAPSPRPYFTILYYLFPCNLLRFLRGPVSYLTSSSFQSPYTVTWNKALDDDEIRNKSKCLLRGHVCHPSIICHDAEAELIQLDLWAEYDVSRIISESMMLDARNVVVGLRERHQGDTKPNIKSVSKTAAGLLPDPTTRIFTLTSGRPQISLQDMIATSVSLKSNIDVEILRPSSPWPSTLFSVTRTTPSEGNISLPQEFSSSSEGEIPSHVARAISGLQREVLLLRNELNFELWISRENVKHIGRLYQSHILSKDAETERQGLFNKLRKYRAQVLDLERELKDQKEQASSAKNKYADWNTELQKKLREFREEKKGWISEAATLRTAEKEARARFVAQGGLLADATREVFELQTQKKEVQPKIDRLRDYERQIEQHVKIQRLWDEDFRKFNERAENIDLMKSEYRQMQMRLESYENTQAELEENGRCYRRQIQALEARLSLAHRKSDASRQMPAAQMAAYAAEKMTLTKANNKFREENGDLRDEVEEMKAMIELLKGQVSGRRGLVSEPRSSPQLFI